MRRVVGMLLLLLGVAALAGGAAAAVLLGPDGRAITGPHPVETKVKALLTGPGVLSWAGPTVTVDVTVPDAKPVFVGVANTVDVEDYLQDTDRIVLDGLRIPWQVETERVNGRPYVPAAPTSIDWWIASGSGQGGAVASFELPEESASVAVIALGETTLRGMTITASYDVRGGFGIGLGVAALGIGVALFGWVAMRRPAPADDWDDEDWDDEDWRDENVQPPAELEEVAATTVAGRRVRRAAVRGTSS